MLRVNATLEFITMNKYLRIAAAQFPVSHDMGKNYRYIKKLIKKASDSNVEVIHFPETALPGYLNFPKGDPSEFDWNTLELLTEDICSLAGSNSIWVILGLHVTLVAGLKSDCVLQSSSRNAGRGGRGLPVGACARPG